MAYTRKRAGRLPAQVRVAVGGDMLGESHLGGATNVYQGAVRATAPTRLLLLPQARYADAVKAVPMLGVIIEDYATIRQAEAAFVEGMRRTEMFRDASPRLLVELFQSAEVVRPRAEQPVIREGEPPHGFYLVLAGTLRAARLVAKRPVVVGELHRGDTFGHLALRFAPYTEPNTVAPVASSDPPALLAFVPKEILFELLGNSAGYRRMLGASRTARQG